ncbi:hypothetical protein [Pseudomonas xantholysinigenes]
MRPRFSRSHARGTLKLSTPGVATVWMTVSRVATPASLTPTVSRVPMPV